MKDARCPVSVQSILKEHGMKTKLIDPTTEMEWPSSNNLEHCLSLYTALDVLDEDNKFICDLCTDKLKKEWRNKKVCCCPSSTSQAFTQNKTCTYEVLVDGIR